MPIKFTLASHTKPAVAVADVLVMPVFKDLNLSESLPKALRTQLKSKIKKLEFKGEWGSAEFMPWSTREIKAEYLALVGVGDRKTELDRFIEGWRRGLGKVVSQARAQRLRSLAINLLDVEDASSWAVASVETVELASYRFTDYLPRLQKEQERQALRSVILLTQPSVRSHVRQVVASTSKVMAGVELARHLVNQPGSALFPHSLVEIARNLAKDQKNISVRVLDKKQAEKENFTAFLAVAKGSQHEPYVIHLTYRPTNPTGSVFVVGKGITFDSGGLSLKPAQYMETMKIDMAGAAAVLGLFHVLPSLDLPYEVHGVIAACENMPSGSAYRPGDVVRAKNGKTIEVSNTDAEGRVTLADALSYAVEHTPKAIIDLATLTGACMIALGDTHAGLWSNQDSLREQLISSARRTGENIWPMPMPDEYRPLIDSQVADLRNIPSSRFGDAITAAMFLKEFVGDTPWAHIDIASPAYYEHPRLPYYPVPGASGYGVRLLVDFLKGFKETTK